MTIKADGTSTRKGAYVNGATLVKDEASDLWAVDDGKGRMFLVKGETFGMFDYSDACVASELLRSLVHGDYAPRAEVAP